MPPWQRTGLARPGGSQALAEAAVASANAVRTTRRPLDTAFSGPRDVAGQGRTPSPDCDMRLDPRISALRGVQRQFSRAGAGVARAGCGCRQSEGTLEGGEHRPTRTTRDGLCQQKGGPAPPTGHAAGSANDVWEHAYYLSTRYPPRPTTSTAWWVVVETGQVVSDRLNAKAGCAWMLSGSDQACSDKEAAAGTYGGPTVTALPLPAAAFGWFRVLQGRSGLLLPIASSTPGGALAAGFRVMLEDQTGPYSRPRIRFIYAWFPSPSSTERPAFLNAGAPPVRLSQPRTTAAPSPVPVPSPMTVPFRTHGSAGDSRGVQSPAFASSHRITPPWFIAWPRFGAALVCCVWRGAGLMEVCGPSPCPLVRRMPRPAPDPAQPDTPIRHPPHDR